MTECCACWDGGDVYGLEIKSGGLFKGTGNSGKIVAGNQMS